MQQRRVFFISDSTGITAESLGHSLLTQFENVTFNTETIPYVDTAKKAHAVVEKINHAYQQDQIKPLVFATLVRPEIQAIIQQSQGQLFDFFHTFLKPLEQELGSQSTYSVGKSHSMINFESYKHRIDAVNFALQHDDGIKVNHYHRADVILVGVSRCGKTPTCLYLALQFGILAANYPLTDEELHHLALPASLKPHKAKLFGLVIDPERLQGIRSERRPNSQYSSLEQCRREVNEAKTIYQREQLPCLNTTYYSIEEIATKILAKTQIERRVG
ncbi:MAG: pyruvate, phosphate dikinase/phosphoenolpyruvate synthase regulator [Legionellales bacterium]|nr:pyruvate, phosphate dikinase/phosphoenolpyruvate synthase regulator [Legionellales bacterium]